MGLDLKEKTMLPSPTPPHTFNLRTLCAGVARRTQDAT